MLGQRAWVGTVFGAVGKQVTSALGRNQRAKSRTTAASLEADPIMGLFASVRYLLAERQDGLVLHVVSASAGEGASSVAEALAKIATESADVRVLLVDGSSCVPGGRSSPRRRTGELSIAAMGEVVGAQPGRAVSTLVTDAQPVPSAQGGTDPLSLYPDYRSKFDLTIIDCPPVTSGRYSDLAPEAADGVILVVEAEKMRPVVLRRVTQMIKEQGGMIVGVVLNKSQRYIPETVYRFI